MPSQTSVFEKKKVNISITKIDRRSNVLALINRLKSYIQDTYKAIAYGSFYVSQIEKNMYSVLVFSVQPAFLVFVRSSFMYLLCLQIKYNIPCP